MNRAEQGLIGAPLDFAPMRNVGSTFAASTIQSVARRTIPRKNSLTADRWARFFLLRRQACAHPKNCK
jgi:hypothetical protein